MSDCICKKCKAVVGRGKLKDGSCVDVEACMKLMKWQKTPKDDEDYRPKRILDTKYFAKYRYKQGQSLRYPDKPRPEETG